MERRNWLEINLDHLVDNFLLLESLCQNSLMPVIKANAYAHGAVEVAEKLLLNTSCSRFAVADISEAVEVRKGLKKIEKSKKSKKYKQSKQSKNSQSIELISLSPVINEKQIKQCLKYQVIPAVPSKAAFDQLIIILSGIKPKKPLPIWLKINTGMNRLGIQASEAKSIIKKCQCDHSHSVNLQVLITHLSSAEEEPEIFTNSQIKQFNQLIQSLERPIKTSIGNSAFLLNPKISQFDTITRSGLSLYGVHPFYFETIAQPLDQICKKLKPTASLKAKIIALDTIKKGQFVGYSRTWKAPKKTHMATVSIGYADGYPRQIPSGTKVLVNNQIASIIGRISMDTCSIDLNQIEAKLGDTVTLFGDGLDVNEIAKQAQTIAYEILTRARPRGGVVYINQ